MNTIHKLFIVLTVLVAGFFIVAVGAAHAQMMGTQETTTSTTNTSEVEHIEPIEAVLKDILTKQGVTTVQQIDCSRVSQADLERLGESFMEEQHPGKAHEAMDQMMGGEGSFTLKQAHINMGSSYLGCGGGRGYGMMGTRAGGMMGYGANRYAPGGMMGESYWAGSPILVSLTWIAFIAFLLAGAYFFIRQSHKK